MSRLALTLVLLLVALDAESAMAQDLNKTLAGDLLQLVGMAYSSKANVINMMLPTATVSMPAYRMRLIQLFVSPQEAHVAVFQYGDDLVLAFPGTKSFNDWAIDVQFWTAFFHEISEIWQVNARIHTGFLSQWRTLSAKLQRLVITWLAVNPSGRVISTGHSLGGGMAVLCGTILYAHPTFRELDTSRLMIVTMGSPPIGNIHFANQWDRTGLKDITWRLVNGNDIVPTLLPFMLHHVGRLVHLHDDQQVEYIQARSVWKRLFCGKFTIEAHVLERYLMSIDKWSLILG